MKKNILVVEDDNSIAELLIDYLEASNFKVDLVTDGVSALDRIKNTKYNLIVLDIMLPGLNGFDILKEVRDIKFIPIIVLSARKEEIDKIKGLNLGADDYITKPFNFGELVARVNAHISKYERLKKKFLKKEDKILTIRGLEIQKESRRVFVNGKEISMAQKEFDLLYFLAKNPNRVYSKEDLFEIIWGLDSLGDNVTVTVHIGRIREKIELKPSNPQYIETVWGAGYRFKI
ncbi:MAG: response regulator transcription factor [Clostridiales bacterium]